MQHVKPFPSPSVNYKWAIFFCEFQNLDKVSQLDRNRKKYKKNSHLFFVPQLGIQST